MKSQRKRFTLIELLVVIAIIGILASMMLPSLGKARRQAVATSCLGNNKQGSAALGMYMSDNDQFWNINSTRATWGIPNVSKPLNTYLGINSSANSQVALCPKDSKPGGNSWYTDSDTSYHWSRINLQNKKFSSFGNHSMVPFAIEPTLFHVIFVGSVQSSAPYFHEVKKNRGAAAYMDGHAAFIRPIASTLTTGDYDLSGN